MSNTPKGEVLEVRMVGKLTAKELANPKKVLALDGDAATFTLGRILGIATECRRKDVADPKSGVTTTYWPLYGQFVGITPDGAQVRSGVLYLPTGIHEAYKTAVDNMEEGDNLRFAIELRTRKDSNLAGYSYVAIDLMPPKVVDPLAEFKLAAESENNEKQKKLEKGK